MPLFETKRVDLPSGDWVDVRELSVGELREADRKGTEEAAAIMRVMPDKFLDNAMAERAQQNAERLIRYEGYDPVTLIKHGITGWSFEEECNDESKGRLSATQGEIVARAIFEMSVLLSGEGLGSSTNYDGAESPRELREPTSITVPEGIQV